MADFASMDIVLMLQWQSNSSAALTKIEVGYVPRGLHSHGDALTNFRRFP